MKIVIDARFYGLEHAGLGRYTINLIDQLIKLDQINSYCLLINNSNQLSDKLPPNFQTLKINMPHYSFAEQIKLPGILKQLKPDIVHFPHYNVPILYRGKFIVTIFDLIKHKYPYTSNTNSNYFISRGKNMAYRLDMWWAVNRSCQIITAANAVKSDLIQNYHVNESKINVIPLGVDERIVALEVDLEQKFGVTFPYIIYVGNGYLYKNVQQIVKALKFIDPTMHLVLIGSRNVFQSSLQELISGDTLQDRVHILGYVDDATLGALYRSAFAFVSASKKEGFGIPPLEAMKMQCPVVLSSIPVHQEICGEAALYFKVDDSNDLAEKIKKLNNTSIRDELIKKGYNYVNKYSWQQMAQRTIELYQQS